MLGASFAFLWAGISNSGIKLIEMFILDIFRKSPKETKPLPPFHPPLFLPSFLPNQETIAWFSRSLSYFRTRENGC